DGMPFDFRLTGEVPRTLTPIKGAPAKAPPRRDRQGRQAKGEPLPFRHRNSQDKGFPVMALKAAILPVTPFQQNCTLLWNDDNMRGAVSDPGGDLDRIKQAAAELGATIEKILLTHGHLDHASAAGDLARELGIPIEGPHEDDLFL